MSKEYKYPKEERPYSSVLFDKMYKERTVQKDQNDLKLILERLDRIEQKVDSLLTGYTLINGVWR